eukprot:230248-Hanusia_phi.AAC.2
MKDVYANVKFQRFDAANNYNKLVPFLPVWFSDHRMPALRHTKESTSYHLLVQFQAMSVIFGGVLIS